MQYCGIKYCEVFFAIFTQSTYKFPTFLTSFTLKCFWFWDPASWELIGHLRLLVWGPRLREVQGCAFESIILKTKQFQYLIKKVNKSWNWFHIPPDKFSEALYAIYINREGTEFPIWDIMVSYIAIFAQLFKLSISCRIFVHITFIDEIFGK